MKKEEKENEKFKFKELFTNKQYRSIMVLAFYAILFTVLIVTIRTPGKSNFNNMVNKGTKIDGYELIDNKNFSYKYTILVDDEEYIYEGKKYNNKDLFTVTKDEESVDYYMIDDKTYIKNGAKYFETLSKPIIIFDFFDTDIIDRLITRSSAIEDEENRYMIGNQNLYDVLSSDRVRVEDGDNFIVLKYRNSNITEINFELDNYAKIIGEKYDKVRIKLEYSDFNLIDDFNDITVE